MNGGVSELELNTATAAGSASGENDVDFKRQRELIQKKRDEEELAKRREEDRKIEEQIQGFSHQNQEILARAQKRKEERARKDRELFEKRQARQRKYEEDLLKLKEANEQRKRERAEREKEQFNHLNAFTAATSPLGENGYAFTSDLIKESLQKKKQKEEEDQASLAEQREKAVQSRVSEPDIRDYMTKEELGGIARELHARLVQIESEKYDLSVKIDKQQYELKEVSTRIVEMQKRKRKSSRLDVDAEYNTSDLLQDLIAEDDKGDIMMSGSQLSIQSSGGVRGRLSQIARWSTDSLPPPVEYVTE